MENNHSDKVKSIFLAAIERCGPERAAYLDGACGGDAELRCRVEELLRAHEQMGSFHEQPAAGVATANFAPLAEGPGTVIGRYKLLQKIGEGGFGVVFMAEQREPVVRKVALKIIKPGMDTKEVITRFEAERQALALMDHPNIARVLDAGSTNSGRPYFVMELVKGVPITDYCDKNELPAEERLKLFDAICHAVQHAHQKGIIHRDIKPSNILVTLHDGRPVPKVIDFGVSKAISQRLTEKTLFTAYGQMIGTPQYMSPEQAEMSGLDVDTRSDVYSLGVLLYELLTGTTPLEGERLRTVGYAEMQRIIREEDPPLPSVRLSIMGEQLTAVAKHRSTDAKRLRQTIRGELDWIVMKSLEKERGRRYESPNSMAEDLGRFLSGEPVEAHPPSTVYRLRKFVRRNRFVVAAALAVSLVLLAGIIGTTYGLIQARHDRDIAVGERQAKEEALDVAKTEQQRAEEQAGVAKKAKRVAEASEKLTRRQRYVSDMYAAAFAWEANNIDLVDQLLNRYTPQDRHEDLRGFEWHYLRRLQGVSPVVAATHIPVDTNWLAASPNGEHIAVGDIWGVHITVWDLKTRVKLDEFGSVNFGQHVPTKMAFSADGTTLAYTNGDFGKVYLRDLDRHTERQLSFDKDEYLAAVVSSSSDVALATKIGEGKVRLREVKTGRVVAELVAKPKFPVSSVVYSSGGRYIATLGANGGMIWEVASRQPKWTFRASTTLAHPLALSPDGKQLASLTDDRSVQLWDTESGRLLQRFPPFPDEVREADFSPEGKLLAVGGRDRAVRLWDVATYSDCGVIRTYNGCYSLRFLSDGRLVFGSTSGVTVCDVRRTPQDQALAAKGGVGHVTLTNIGGRLLACAIASPPNTIRIWRIDQDRMEELPEIRPGFKVGCVKATVAGRLILGESNGQRMAIYDLSSMQLKEPFLTKAAKGVSSIALSKDGRQLAVGCTDGRIAIWRIDKDGFFAQSSPLEYRAHEQKVTSLAFHPSGTVIASGSGDHCVKVWNVADGTINYDFGYQAKAVTTIAFSPDGERLAAGLMWPSVIKIWRWPSRVEEMTLRGHSSFPVGLEFLRDGRTIVSSGADRLVKIWDLESQQERFNLRGGSSIFTSLAISPDEKTFAAGARDGTVHFFRSERGGSKEA